MQINSEKELIDTERRGTLQYMDPIVARQSDYDHRSDFYSYCVVASEILTGIWAPEINGIGVVLGTFTNKRPDLPDQIPQELRHHILSGYEEDPDMRSSWDDVIDATRE